MLSEQPASRGVGRHTGLYHFALLLPDRTDLARWLAHAARDRVPLVGLSDHFVSEALYLSDPDGHGIEIYWDRPRAGWEGRVERMTTLRLDVDDLLGELDNAHPEPFDRLPDATRMGHIHLKVAEIDETIAFYSGVLGFARDGPTRRAGGVSERRRLPPSHRLEHVGERRRVASAAGRRASPPRDDRRPRRGRAGPRTRACRRQRADAGARRRTGRSSKTRRATGW